MTLWEDIRPMRPVDVRELVRVERPHRSRRRMLRVFETIAVEWILIFVAVNVFHLPFVALFIVGALLAAAVVVVQVLRRKSDPRSA